MTDTNTTHSDAIVSTDAIETTEATRLRTIAELTDEMNYFRSLGSEHHAYNCERRIALLSRPGDPAPNC